VHGHFDDARRTAAEDLGALAESIFELDVPVEPPAAHEEYLQALDAFKAAEGKLDAARRQEDLAPVTILIAEGMYRMACVRALRKGRQRPKHLPPCLFDPRHGPAIELIVWAPVGGDPRTVPSCAEDAELLERDLQPRPRTVIAGHREVPFWDTGREFAGWFAGYFSPGDICDPVRILEGLPLGEALRGVDLRT
jgi:hypothetical protein